VKAAFAILALAACAFPGCGLDDGKFYKGTGTVTGRVFIDDDPVADAEVNWLRDESIEQSTSSEAKGFFGLEGLRVGEGELLLRYAKEKCRGLRIEEVRVVAGHEKKMNRLDLREAFPIRVVVMEKQEVEMEDTQVFVEEFPGIENIKTELDGEADLPCIPRSGCYTIRADAHPYTFELETRICPEGEEEWESDVTLTPEGDLDVFEQVHHAYSRLDKMAADLMSCESECFFFEDGETGPPCTFPIGDLHSEKQGKIDDLRKEFTKMRDLDRFTGSWADIKCPPYGELHAECDQGICRMKPDPGVAATMLHTWTTQIDVDTYKYIATDREGLLERCSQLGADCSEHWQPGSVYVFSQAKHNAFPTAVDYVLQKEESVELYLRADMWLDYEAHGMGPGRYVWTLLRLDFAVVAPENLQAAVHLSWIDPR